MNIRAIKWNTDSLPTRLAVVELCGWTTNKGTISRLGKRIAQLPWERLSPAAQNVLKYHGVQP